MARFAFAVNAFNGSFRNGWLWLIQFLVNPLLFALFTAWLLIPVANTGYLILNILFALVLLVASLVLHGGTLNYFSSQGRSEGATLRAAFHCALRNVLAVVAGVAIVYLLWALVGKAGSYQETFPAYMRSALPAFLRRQAGLPFFQGLFDAALFALRWILIPGLLLPLLARASQFGFRGFGREGLTELKQTLFSVSYWGLIMVAALLGVLATQKIMGWTPDFRTSTLAEETTSVIFRSFVAYLLGLFAWMLACSAVGCQGEELRGAAADPGGQAVG